MPDGAVNPGGDGGITPGQDGGTTPGQDGGTTPGQDSGTPPDSGTSPTSGWTFHSHPCSGNRTDALWVDADGTAFVGCGSTTTGAQGFYVSTNGGATWTRPTTSPAGYFETWRVHDISRSADGLLYVAGQNTANNHRVASVDTSASPWTLELVLQSQPTVGFSFNVGGFRRNAAGRAIAESATGTDILYRESDSGDWLDGSSWYEGTTGLQISQLVEYDGTFYGSGSRINQPPYLFISLPAAEGFGFQQLQLASGIGMYNGEMWGLAVDEGGIVIGGVNQARNVGMVYALNHGSTATRVMDVSTFYPDDPTWIRGACRRGSNLFAVGELSMRNRGLVLESTDNGATWRDITPESTVTNPFPPVHRCAVRSEGTAWVAGADGVFAVYAR